MNDQTNKATDSLKPKILRPGATRRAAALWDGVNRSGYMPIDDKVLVLPDEMLKMTEGGIEIPDEVQDRQQLAVEYATVVAIGPAAFELSGDRVRHWDFDPTKTDKINRKPRVGERIFMERFSGQILLGDDGRTYRVIDDKCISAIHDRDKPVKEKE